jgi:hypothetical protein
LLNIYCLVKYYILSVSISFVSRIVPLLMILLLIAIQIKLYNSLINPSTVATGLKQMRRYTSILVYIRMILLMKIGWLILSSIGRYSYRYYN